MKSQTLRKQEILSRIIGPEATSKLALKFFKACPGYDPLATKGQFLSQHPSAKAVSASNMVSELFKIFYGKIDAQDIVPDESVSRVSALVPYIKNTTDVLIFNFLRCNYGIRDPLLVRLSVLVGDKCYWSKQYLFAPNEVKYLKNFTAEADQNALLENGIVMLEAFHPRIETPGNEFRFFMLLNNPVKGTLSGIHSIPAPLIPYQKRDEFCFRAFIPSEQQAYYCNFADPHQVLQSNSTNRIFRQAQSEGPIKGSMGFCIVHDDKGIPMTLWHDNCSSNMKNIRNIPTKEKLPHGCVTTFYVPDFEVNAPLINVIKEEIGFDTESFKIKAYRESGEMIAEKRVQLTGDSMGFDLAKIFAGEQIQGSAYFVADFERDQNEFDTRPPCYLHLFYRRGEIFADQVHSQYSFGYHNDSTGLPKSYRCLKMAPLIKEFRSVYCLATAGGVRKSRDNTITLRVFTDTGTEHVFNRYPLKVPDGVSVIHGDDLLKEIDCNIDEAAVVWFEHSTTNFNGNWFLVNRKTGHLATDHFTGA